jgi:glyoxylase-like metal-dependent hydrolase (beta-lactamase superfamily II)
MFAQIGGNIMFRHLISVIAILLVGTAAHAAPGDVHTYRSSANGLLVNSYYVETNRGVVVIDTQFLLSEAQKLKVAIEALGKPIIAIIITHPHPDHYNGIGVLGADRVKLDVFATRATIDGIKSTEAEKRREWKPVYKDDYPDTTYIPNRVVKSGDTIKYDGLQLRLEEVEGSEASSLTMVYHPARRALFTSDLVYNRIHPWLVEGRSSAWLAQLGFVAQKYTDVTTIYPGHGEIDTLMAVNRQLDYINTLQMLIRPEVDKSGKFTDQAKEVVKGEMLRRYPGYPLEMLLDGNIMAVGKELTTGAGSDRR